MTQKPIFKIRRRSGGISRRFFYRKFEFPLGTSCKSLKISFVRNSLSRFTNSGELYRNRPHVYARSISFVLTSGGAGRNRQESVILSLITGGHKYEKSAVTTCNDASAPQVGLEPTTTRLTAECSAIELSRITYLSEGFCSFKTAH